MRIDKYTISLLVLSIILDMVQGYMLFMGAICIIPSITGVGIVATIACELGLEGINLIAVIIWYTLSKILLKKPFLKIDNTAYIGVAEAIPFVSALPMFTTLSIYNMYSMKRPRK